MDLSIQVTQATQREAWPIYKTLLAARFEAGEEPALAMPMFITTLQESLLDGGSAEVVAERLASLVSVAVEHAWAVEMGPELVPEMADLPRAARAELIDGVLLQVFADPKPST